MRDKAIQIKRFISFLSIFLVFASSPHMLHADEIRIFSPTTIKIELTGKEPKPSSLGREIGFGPGGAEGPRIFLVRHDAPYWKHAPAYVTPNGAQFQACGFSSAQLPEVKIIMPDKSLKSVELTPVEDNRDCFTIPFVVNRGDQLGLYTIVLKHPDAVLQHTFGLDLAFCPSINRLPSSDNRKVIYNVTGTKSGENLQAFLFRRNSEEGEFLAKRDVKSGSDGTLSLEIVIQPSANLTPHDLRVIVLGENNEPYRADSGLGEPTHIWLDGFSDGVLNWPQRDAISLYPTYTIPTGKVGETGTYNPVETYSPNGFSCDGSTGQFAQLYSPNKTPIAYYAEAQSTEIAIGSFEAGQPVEVLKQQITESGGRVRLWYQVSTESRITGWISAPSLIPIETRLVAGGLAQVRTNMVYGSLNNAYTNVGFYPGLPELIAGEYSYPPKGSNRDLPPDTIVRLIEADGSHWLVETPTGERGWVTSLSSVGRLILLTGLPWSPKNIPVQPYTAYTDQAQFSRIATGTSAGGWHAETRPAVSNAGPKSAAGYWTLPGNGRDWVIWSFVPKATGKYHVTAFIPSLWSSPTYNTSSANYQIQSRDTTTTVVVNQQVNIGKEVDLGTYEFEKGKSYSVKLSDDTGEKGKFSISVDTITWTPVTN